MSGQERRSASVATIVGYLATAAAIVAVSVVLISAQDRSPWFWHRIIWCEVLAVLLWGYFGGFLQFVLPHQTRRRGAGGILPAVGLVLILYTITSFTLVVAVKDPSTGRHLATQILLLAVAVVLFATFEFARAGAVAGTEPIPQGIRAPQDLCTMLRSCEERLWSSSMDGETRKLHAALKTLREAIQYSLQRAGRIGQSPDYSAFATETAQLCGDLESAVSRPSENPSTSRFCGRAEELRRKVDVISAVLKVKG